MQCFVRKIDNGFCMMFCEITNNKLHLCLRHLSSVIQKDQKGARERALKVEAHNLIQSCVQGNRNQLLWNTML